ncbi:MAG: dynamin family protein [Cyanobacteria bacterium J06598_3]
MTPSNAGSEHRFDNVTDSGIGRETGNGAADGSLQAWAQFSAQRGEVTGILKQITQILQSAEVQNTAGTGDIAPRSGQLGIDASIHEIQQASESLSTGIYRLMIMGDMKRGKSTLLNALIGENLLPSDVNPCTALLTILRYGPEKRVTLHYKDEARQPETITIETFKQSYTIDPAESKKIEAQGTEAFPDIRHVVVEYPLPLLQQGIELIDTPGLNDTEARNDQVLGYLSDCQAVLFVLDATQPLTLDEQRYLNNYLKDSGLALFFVVNGWDRIKSGLVNPDDAAAVAEAEAKVRQVFQTNLADYAVSDAARDSVGDSTGDATGDSAGLRLFEISALQALRQSKKGESLEGSGLLQLLGGLDHFLAYERGPAELQRALSVAQRAYRNISTSISRRIPLLDESLESLEAKVVSVQSDFGKLEAIRDRYRKVILTSSEIQAQAISESFRTYILDLENTFEEDFADSQPDLEFTAFLQNDKRKEFYKAFKRAFERYINDRLAAWGFTAKQSIGSAFDELNANAADYQVAYAEIVDVINEKIMGQRYHAVGQRFDDEGNNIWIDNVKDVFGGIPEGLNNSIRGFNYFWQSVLQMALAYVCIVVFLQILGVIFSSLFLNVVGVIFAAGGILTVQAEFVRQEFLKATKTEFAKHLPKIATEQGPNIYRSVKDCFKEYEKQAIGRIDDDIDSRKVELTSLIEQKQSHEINKEQEVARLEQLERAVQENIAAIESMVSV